MSDSQLFKKDFAPWSSLVIITMRRYGGKKKL
jgi:hypothetical protein